MVRSLGPFSGAMGPCFCAPQGVSLISPKLETPEIKMQKLLLTATLAALAFSAVAPAQALTFGNGLFDASTHDGIDRRRPRVPGGSGCDDPRDLIEHPECTPA